MKSSVLIAITTLLVSTNAMPVLAASADQTKSDAVIETSNAKTQGVRFFHARKKLALKQDVGANNQTNNDGLTPEQRDLDYGSDSFIITGGS